MSNTEPSAGESKQLNKWQSKLLPWMVAMPTALIIIFIYLSTKQLTELSSSIGKYRAEPIVNNLTAPSRIVDKGDPLYDNLEYIKFYARLKMEERALDHRYAQTGFLLIARTYTKYLGFFTGMILAIVSSVFIISKLKEDTSDIEGTISEKMKFRVVSSSPGIIFGILGTTLILTTLLYNPEIQQTDSPLYLIPEITTEQSTLEPVGITPPKEKTIENLGKSKSVIPEPGEISIELIQKNKAARDSAESATTQKKN